MANEIHLDDVLRELRKVLDGAGRDVVSLGVVKDLELAAPRYASWRHAGGNYKELL